MVFGDKVLNLVVFRVVLVVVYSLVIIYFEGVFVCFFFVDENFFVLDCEFVVFVYFNNVFVEVNVFRVDFYCGFFFRYINWLVVVYCLVGEVFWVVWEEFFWVGI